MRPIEIDEALEKIRSAAAQYSPLEKLVEELTLQEANGRLLLKTVTASFDHPPFDQALRDGIAFRHQDGIGPLELVDSVFAGMAPNAEIGSGQAVKIMTGAPVPAGANCVEMIERVFWLDEAGNELGDSAGGRQKPWSIAGNAAAVKMENAAPLGQHILKKGSLFRSGQVLIEAGTVLNPASVGLLASTGLSTVAVQRKLKISILITGDEVRAGGSPLKEGQIYNSNGPLLASLARRSSLQILRNDCIGDDDKKLLQWLQDALTDSDLIVTTGGVSAGEKDLLPDLFVEAEVKNHFHGVRIKPGKPIWFGQSGGSCFVFGLPGNPVSCQVCFSVFVRSLLEQIDAALDRRSGRMLTLSEDWKINGDRTTFWPATVGNSTLQTPVVFPMNWKGSADLVGPAAADVLIKFDPLSRPDGIWRSGESVEVFDY